MDERAEWVEYEGRDGPFRGTKMRLGSTLPAIPGGTAFQVVSIQGPGKDKLGMQGNQGKEELSWK